MMATMNQEQILAFFFTTATVIISVYIYLIKRRKSFSENQVMSTNTIRTSTGDDECPICLGPLRNPERLNACNHVFCQECIHQVRERAFHGLTNDACPLCRAPLLEETAEKFFMEVVVIIVRNEQLLSQQPDSPGARDVTKNIITLLERALALDANHIGALTTLGETLSDVTPERAIPLLKHSLTLSPDDGENLAALMALGSALQNLGKTQDAMAQYRLVIAVAERKQRKVILAAVRVKLAMLLEEQGNIPASVQEYVAAMEVAPEDFTIPFNMGVTLEETDTEGAIRAYRMVLEQNRDFSPANVAIAKAYRQRIASNAQDNSFAAGQTRGQDVLLWLGALLRAKHGQMMSPDDMAFCEGEIQTIQRLFPNAWANYQANGERSIMAMI